MRQASLTDIAKDKKKKKLLAAWQIERVEMIRGIKRRKGKAEREDWLVEMNRLDSDTGAMPLQSRAAFSLSAQSPRPKAIHLNHYQCQSNESEEMQKSPLIFRNGQR
ncbi:hypothetical protein WR25_08473 [Diploscapter pachys]|uniref:Uncharacterized protein n=1 Tax=Diploscapter pachys TaxID=2018661 RepID=A0A2A2L5C7_9BILA|nr:hypothetical protein WR25_08473 [Diploscapter pachys]